MNKYFPWIKARTKTVLSIIGIALLVIAIVLSQGSRGANKNNTNPTATPKATPPPPVSGDWGELKDIIKTFGNPITKSSDPDRTDMFKTKSTNRQNVVMYQKDVPVFALQVVTAKDPQTISSIQKKYGEPPVTLFSAASASTDIYLYAYPEKGVAYQANANSGILYEIWYFRPMSEKELMQTWAKDYSTTPQAGGF